MWNPINRTQVQVSDNKFRIYDKRAPLFYKKPDGTYDDIDHTFNDTTSTIGDISLMNKGILSVGKRKGNNPHKVVGIRPDNNQHLGTQQLEFSLINVELDGESQEFNVEDDLEIRLRASRIFQLVKTNKGFNNFKIEFDIYSKGMEIQNDKYSEETTIRDYGFNLTNLGDIEAGVTDITLNNIFSEDKDIPYIDAKVFKITNDYITTGQYSDAEEFGDSDLSQYILDNSLYQNGSGMYYKDCLIFVAKVHNIENYLDIMAYNLADIYGCSLYKDGEDYSGQEYMDGFYFIKDKKKVGGYFADDNVFFAFINTKDISDDIKTLFERKTFKDTSYMDISLDDFHTAINNRFNKDLRITVGTNYYEPINNRFKFKISNESIYINKPVIFDKDYEEIKLKTTHTLTDNEDGSFRYTKYFDTEGCLSDNSNIKYIDATLSTNHTDDSAIKFDYSTGSTVKKTSSSFTGIRNATSATAAIDDGGSNHERGIVTCGDAGWVSTVTIGKSTTTTRHYKYIQSHFKFDSSGISTTVSDLEFKCKGAYASSDQSSQSIPEDISIILLKASSGSNTGAALWNDFDGFTSDWDADDVTEYSSETVIDGTESAGYFLDFSIGTAQGGDSPLNYADESATLNSTAKTDIEDNDTFEFSIIDYDQYYLNSYDGSYASTVTTNSAIDQRTFWMLQIDNSTSSYRPYLEYTVAGGDAVSYNANFFGANF